MASERITLQLPEGRELSLAPYLTMINAFRRAHSSTHWLRNITFHEVDNPDVLAWSKRDGAGLREHRQWRGRHGTGCG